MSPIRRALRRSAAGFTLIELMIAVAIIGILAAVGYPQYTDYVRRGQIAEAFGLMSDYRVKLEQYFQDYKKYGSATGANCADAATAPAWASFAGSKHFQAGCKVTDSGYTLTVTGFAGQAVGHTYTVDEANRQTTKVFKGEVVDKPCWLQKGNEC